MKKERTPQLDIQTKKKSLLNNLHCLHGAAVIRELNAYKNNCDHAFAMCCVGEEYYIDTDPSFLIMRVDRGSKLLGVVATFRNCSGEENAKVIYFDMLDRFIEEYDQELVKTGKKIYAKTRDVHDVFDAISCCKTYVDVWNTIRGKRIKVAAINKVTGARHNAAGQVSGIREYHLPVFCFCREKTIDGKYHGPVKKAMINQELFGSAEVEGKNVAIYYYDKEGFLQKKESIDEDNNVIVESYEYKRNDSGEILEEKCSDGSSIKHFYSHNKELLKTQEVDCNGDVRKEIEFNNDGKISKKTEFYHNKIQGEVVYKYDRKNRLWRTLNGLNTVEFCYDNLGNLIEEKELKSWDNNKLSRIVSYKYSPDGLLLEKSEKGTFVGKIEYKYDESNKLAEELEYWDPCHNGIYVGRSRIIYRHDAYGNCIFMELSDFDGRKVSSREVIEIEYYNNFV